MKVFRHYYRLKERLDAGHGVHDGAGAGGGGWGSAACAYTRGYRGTQGTDSGVLAKDMLA